MKSNRTKHISVVSALLILFLVAANLMRAQEPSKFVGTITAINGNTITVKADANGERQVEVPAMATLKRIAPGQKDLSVAESIQFSDLAIGDRALVKLDPNAPAGSLRALQIVAIKQSDMAMKQQKDREDWQRRGVGGLVKSVDAASGVILLNSGSGATAKTIAVHTTKATVLKRYAAASVRFDEALPAPIDAIHAGDQLRARGTKNADGSQIAAEEVVSGSFRNISGTIASLDTTGSTLVVKDLATKKQITIHISAEAQMRRLPDRMAQMLAARLKGSMSGGASGWGGDSQMSNAAPAGPQRGGAGQWSDNGLGQAGGVSQRTGGSGESTGQWAGQGGGGAGPDPQQMLNRAPAIQLSDLKKGEAVMLVSSDGTTDVTAITLLAGVEPLLEAPAASKNLLSNWSMNTGAPDATQ